LLQAEVANNGIDHASNAMNIGFKHWIRRRRNF